MEPERNCVEVQACIHPSTKQFMKQLQTLQIPLLNLERQPEVPVEPSDTEVLANTYTISGCYLQQYVGLICGMIQLCPQNGWLLRNVKQVTILWKPSYFGYSPFVVT